MDGFVEYSSQFAALALCAAVSSLPLFLLVGAITWGGRRWLSARARFALWTLVLVRMIVPFSVETPFGLGMFFNHWTVYEAIPVAEPHGLLVEYDETGGVQLSDSVTGDVSSLSPMETWMMCLETIAWISLPVVSLLLAGWLLATSVQLTQRVRHGIEPNDPGWSELLAQGRKEFNIRVPVHLRVLSNWTTPATMGFFRPVIILPEDAALLSRSELQHVLWHELAHIKRCDTAWNGLWIAARCFQWWNPCFWMTQRAWLAERELACDALVMQHLGSDAATDYGRTLLRFLERLSQSPRFSPAVQLPGLVMFLGGKSAIRRRLQALAHPLVIETAWGRWASFGVLLLLAILGLTDAAASKVVVLPKNDITVPAGTEWQFGLPDAPDEPDLSQVVRQYDVSKAVARIRQDAPGARAEIEICQMIQGSQEIFPWINGKPQSGHCVIEGNFLTVTATQPQQAAVQMILSHWEKFGQRQITVEVRFLSTEKNLSDLLPTPGGQIVSPLPHQELDLLAPVQTAHEVNNSLVGPSFVRVISPSERDHVTQLLQSDARSSLMFAPKVTLFSGQSANVSDKVQRPFVTGLRSLDGGKREPQISMFSEGVQFGMRAMQVEGERQIQLNLQVRKSELLDVEVVKAQIAGQEEATAVQVPHVRESNLKTAVTLTSDHSVLVSPLRRDKQGKLQIYLVTPRLIEGY
ncbi:MAG: M56 family metallopeptidase [Planctomycetaceae bacterium]